MNAAQKFAAFLAGLAVVFAVAFWAGRTLGPERTIAENATPQEHAAAELPGGLMTTQQGYTLELVNSRATVAENVPVQFRILDATGAPVTRYTDNHEKPLHLIVVRNDLAAFQHVHPVLDANGTWSVPLDLSRAGDYRVLADFIPAGGPDLTLGANLHVGGNYDPNPLPAPLPSFDVDGYTVTLTGTPSANEATMLTLKVSRGGQPVTDLQPYLGAYGHLVALRATDLAYLHVHPMGGPGEAPSGPDIVFHTTFPSDGDYRLFLDFRHQDVVRTAEFTVSIRQPQSAEPSPSGHGHH